MKKCRLYSGDAVIIEYGKKCIYIKRDDAGGLTLSPSSATSKGDAIKQKGTHCTCTIKAKLEGGMSHIVDRNISSENVITDHDTYSIIIPIV